MHLLVIIPLESRQEQRGQTCSSSQQCVSLPERLHLWHPPNRAQLLLRSSWLCCWNVVVLYWSRPCHVYLISLITDAHSSLYHFLVLAFNCGGMYQCVLWKGNTGYNLDQISRISLILESVLIFSEAKGLINAHFSPRNGKWSIFRLYVILSCPAAQLRWLP